MRHVIADVCNQRVISHEVVVASTIPDVIERVLKKRMVEHFMHGHEIGERQTFYHNNDSFCCGNPDVISYVIPESNQDIFNYVVDEGVRTLEETDKWLAFLRAYKERHRHGLW